MSVSNPKAIRTVDVWSATTDVSEADYAHYFTLLSAREKERALRFVFAKDRWCYTVAAGVLREILGRYLKLSPQAIHFQYGEHGKPFLLAALNATQLQFNLSHSGKQILLAVTQERELGIDIERMREDYGGVEVAQRFFAEEEYDALIALPKELQAQAFFNGWTRKEAFIKAIGAGLYFPLRDFVVELRPEHKPALVSIKQDVNAAASWSMHDLAVTPGYVAALAIPCAQVTLNRLDYQP